MIVDFIERLCYNIITIKTAALPFAVIFSQYKLHYAI